LPLHPPVTIRPLTTQHDLRRCLELQHETWGKNFTEAVAPSILKISQRLGGVTAGAFNENDELLGFVFGLTGIENGKVVHWSDMLAVRESARGLGVGTALKEWQRNRARDVGATVIYWTYDPLVARNGYINLMKLESELTEYVEDMYGESDSDLHRGLGTDRFVVAWPVDEAPARRDSRRARRRHALARASNAPVINDGRDAAVAAIDGQAEAIAIAVPGDILEIQNRSTEEAAAWRRSTRAAFQKALAAGYEAVAIDAKAGEPLARYILLRGEQQRSER
jgi:predicted GNAT superfamily acetyltransferase